MEDDSAIMNNLARDLKECADYHSVLLEWKRLHDHLQRLEWSFGLIGDKVKRKGYQELTPEDISEIKRSWPRCRTVISADVIPFARRIRHIGKPYKGDGQLSGEDWIIRLVAARDGIDAALEELSYKSLHDLVGTVDSLITRHLHIADKELQNTKADLNDFSARLLGSVAKISDRLVAEEVREFVRIERHLLEWIDLHGLFQRLKISFASIYSIVSEKEASEIDSDDRALMERIWQSYQDAIFNELITFAKQIIYIGKAYHEDEEGNLYGEKWAVELVQVARGIDGALEEIAIRSLRKSIMKFHDLISQHYRITDHELMATVDSLNTLSSRLRWGIESAKA